MLENFKVAYFASNKLLFMSFFGAKKKVTTGKFVKILNDNFVEYFYVLIKNYFHFSIIFCENY